MKILKRILLAIGVPLLIILMPIELVLFTVRWIFTGKSVPKNPSWYRVCKRHNELH